jgi:hypothetical protein
MWEKNRPASSQVHASRPRPLPASPTMVNSHGSRRSRGVGLGSCGGRAAPPSRGGVVKCEERDRPVYFEPVAKALDHVLAAVGLRS